jgi:8-oxo-dGTP pyrophosphatase MutT (NUDIX family)
MESPAVPRLSATVLVLRDDPLEVLMMRRHAGGTFASALVFPGGAVEEADSDPSWGHPDLPDRAVRVAAVRETWEEVGLVVAAGVIDPQPGMTFTEAVGDATLALDELQVFGHWVTPVPVPRRFDTHFLLARSPVGQVPLADGGEALSAHWVRPEEAIALHDAGSEILPFPTLMNLVRLAESTTVDEAFAAARERQPFTVEPVMTRDGERLTITIPQEAGYSVTTYESPVAL